MKSGYENCIHTDAYVTKFRIWKVGDQKRPVQTETRWKLDEDQNEDNQPKWENITNKFFSTDGRKGLSKLEGYQDGRNKVAPSSIRSRQPKSSAFPNYYNWNSLDFWGMFFILYY